MSRKAARAERLLIVVVPPVDELDLVGPAQVFAAANRLAGRTAYAVEVATTGADLKVEGEGGLIAFHAGARLADVRGPLGSVLLVCGLGNRTLSDPELSAWLRAAAPRARRLGGVCVSAFLLAEAGLLDGRRATVHWRFGEEMARLHPKVRVEHEPIWVQDGAIFTSAGVSAGIDLALAWVEADLGSGMAAAIARELLLFVRRPAGQGQVSAALAAQAGGQRPIRELLVWIADNLHRRLTIDVLAERAAMTVRTLERSFVREVGKTPAQFVLQARIEAARRQLETGARSLDQIAHSCGFGGADVMRRAFLRTLGVPPRAFRGARSAA